MLSEKEFRDFQNAAPHAFKRVFEGYHVSLLRYVCGWIRDEADAEEIVQESFIQLFLHRQKLDRSAAIYPYVFTIAKRQMISYFRRKATSLKYVNSLKENWQEQHEEVAEYVKERDLWEALQDTMGELPARQRQVFWMNKFEHKSYQEIADDLGLSRSTVKNQIITASKVVRLKLSKYYTLVVLIFFSF